MFYEYWPVYIGLPDNGITQDMFNLFFTIHVTLSPNARSLLVVRAELLHSKVKNNAWFMLRRAPPRYGACGKLGEHERSVRVARGDSRAQF